jgi:aquaporin Z
MLVSAPPGRHSPPGAAFYHWVIPKPDGGAGREAMQAPGGPMVRKLVSEQMVRRLVAESLGTGFLVFFGVGVATLMFGFHFDGGSLAAGVIATSLSFGLVLLALVYAIGPLTGCHVNPAVTMGAVVARRLPVREAVGYWAAQFVGGILGALLLWGMFSTSPLYSRSITGLGTTDFGALSDIRIGLGGAFLTEVILTSMFVFVILAVTSKVGNATAAGIAIGLALALTNLVGIPITGASVNPARSLGPALVVGGTPLSQVWLFIVAPLIGGIIAAGFYYLIYPPQRHRIAQPQPPGPAFERAEPERERLRNGRRTWTVKL